MHCHKDRNIDKIAWHPDPLDKQSLKPDPNGKTSTIHRKNVCIKKYLRLKKS